MESYKHMGYSAGAARHADLHRAESYPIAMVFRLAGEEVTGMQEIRWEHLSFPTDAEATDFAAAQCRDAIDQCESSTFPWPDCMRRPPK